MKRLLALLFIIPFFAACSDDSSSTAPVAPTATITVTKTVAPSVTPAPKEKKVPRYTIKLDNKYKLQWARSYNRKVMYKDYETAKFVVARAVEAGRFGKPGRRVETKWRPGQTGWGIIEVNDKWEPNMAKPTAFAQVWFRTDGSIDYSRGITGLRIDAGPTTRGVIMYDKMYGSVGFKPVPQYEAALDQYNRKRGKVWSVCIDNSGICEQPIKWGKQTVTSTDLVQLDEAAITALDKSMTTLFGPNWRQM